MRLALVFLPAAFASGCLLVPPARTSVGAVSSADDNGRANGYRVTVGAHTASGYRRKNPTYDLGAGYIYERLDPTGTRRGDHGTYLEAGGPVNIEGNRRVWLSGRGEVYFSDARETSPRMGATIRLSIDRFLAGGKGITRGNGAGAAMWSGSGSVDAFVEAGVRETIDDTFSTVAVVGVSIRSPLLFFLGR